MYTEVRITVDELVVSNIADVDGNISIWTLSDYYGDQFDIEIPLETAIALKDALQILIDVLGGGDK